MHVNPAIIDYLYLPTCCRDLIKRYKTFCTFPQNRIETPITQFPLDNHNNIAHGGVGMPD